MRPGPVSRAFGTLIAWIIAGAVGTTLLTVVVALSFGQRPVTVLSGSMEPAISAGDVLVQRRISPLEAHVGDVVTFKEPQSGRLITHRVRSVRQQGEVVAFVTKGDANNTVERWQMSQSGEISRPLMRIPALGYLARFARTPIGLLILILIPLIVLGGFELYRTWRPAPRRRESGAAHA